MSDIDVIAAVEMVYNGGPALQQAARDLEDWGLSAETAATRVGDALSSAGSAMSGLASRPASVSAAIGAMAAISKAPLDTLAGRFNALAGGVGRAVAQVNALRAAINRLPNSKVIRVTASFSAGNAAAGGGNFVTDGPTLLVVGDNPGGRERVDVTPLSGRGQTRIAQGGGLTQVSAAGGLGGGGGAMRHVVELPGASQRDLDVARAVLETFQQAGIIEQAVAL